MKKPQTGKTLTRVVATKINKPKTIESKKATNLENAYIEQGKSSLSKYRKSGSQSDLLKSFQSGKSAAMLNKDVVKNMGVSKANKKMKGK
jgi:hypothetical protein